MKKLIALIAALVMGSLVLSGCSQVTTAPDTVALHYGGGAIEATNYKGCTGPSQRSWEGPGDGFYYYPAGQRNYTFADGGESGPITVVTRDNVTMTVPGIATFTLNTDCADNGGPLRAFHEKIGLKYSAFFDDEDGVNRSDQGWVKMLNDYVGKQLDRAADAAAKKYTWRDLYTNAATKAEFEKEIANTVPAFVKQLAGGDYFVNWSIVINSLVPPENVVQALNDEQAAIAQAAAAKAKALADAQTAQAKADAEIAVQKAKAAASEQEAKAIQNIIDVIGAENYVLLEAIKNGSVKVIPVPEGSNFLVNPNG